MTAVLDPDALTGFHSGPIHYSTEDGRFYVLTDDGAIPADGVRDATTLDADLLAMVGADHFTLRDGQLDMIRPASPNTAAYEDTMIGLHYPGGLSLMNASGTSRLRNRLVLNFLSGGSLDPRITFTRASSATRVNSSGLIETVSSDVARIDYDPVTLASKGLLIEEQRTNLLLRSQEFNNASWTKTDTTITADAAVAPDGTTTADLITEGSAGTAALYQGATIVANATVTHTRYVKRGNTDWVRLFIANGTGTHGVRAWFNLATGAIGTVQSFGLGSGASATIAAAGNGFFRISLTGAVNNSDVSCISVTHSASADAGGRLSGATRYEWGAQLEAGAFATSYIPTTSATVTRAADVASITGTNFSDWFNQTEGTFAISLVPRGMPSTNWRFFAAGNAAGTARVPLMYSNSAGTALVQYRDGGVDQAALGFSVVFAANTRLRLASAYKVNDFAAVANGGTPQTDAAGTIGTVDRLTIGWETSTPSEVFNGWIERITYYPARLSNALLQSLTA